MAWAELSSRHSSVFAAASMGHPVGGRPEAPGKLPSHVGKTLRPAVLVVDDEALILWALQESLAGAGYEVAVATDGAEASRVIDDRQRALDLVLLDLRLPDTTGLALLRRVRTARPSCPVILMTAYNSPETSEAALGQGARWVVSKPFDLGDMMRLVRTCLDEPNES